jgi:hypothetical protein
MDLAPAAHRLLPCNACGYDLRGRRVGDTCPECGWVIDAPGPRWCTHECLQRLASMSRLAWIPCVVLLAVPVLFLSGVAGVGGSDRVWIATLVVFLVLMPLQVVTQAIAVWRMAMPELGEARVKRLRVAAVARVIPFALVGFAVMAMMVFSELLGSGEWENYLLVPCYFLLPLIAVAADFITLRVLISLRVESQVIVSGRHAVLPLLACGALVLVYPLILVPYFGWFFAPIVWAVAMAVGFAQVGAVAHASQKPCQARAMQ